MGRKNCSGCPLSARNGAKVPGSARLGEVRYCEVPYRGPRENVDILIVGESPGITELRQRQPFVGDSGNLVNRELLAVGIAPQSVFFANACRCMLTKEDKQKKDIVGTALSCCRGALELAVRTLKPKLIVCLGDIALAQVIRQSGITKKRGVIQRSDEFDCLVLPTFHPAACLRDQGKFAFWKPDIALIAKLAGNGFEREDKDFAIACKNVDSIRCVLDRKAITVALDLETQGSDWNDPNFLVLSYQVTDRAGVGYNVFLHHECDLSDDADIADLTIQWPRKSGGKSDRETVYVRRAFEYDRRVEELRELCERDDIKIVMHNGLFDLHALRLLGIAGEQVRAYTFDTQTAAHALDPDNFIKASLPDVQTAFLSGTADHKTPFRQSHDISDMLKAAKDDEDAYVRYACGDTISTYACAAVLRERIMADRLLANYYARLAHPVQTRVLYDIEKNGIPFDVSGLPETKERVAAYLMEKEAEFLRLVPGAVMDRHRKDGCVLTRGKFLQDVFFSKAGFDLKPVEKTPGGDPSMNRKGLERLRDALPDGEAKDALSVLIEWGPHHKLYSTYLKGFEAAVKPDGRLHTRITKCGAATGRTSSACPNLQNIPKRNKEIMRAIRGLLIAPAGKVLVAADYSQSELRWIAHESREPEMVHIFRTGQDMHVITGQSLAKCAGYDWESLSDAERDKYRQNAKPVNFGFPYGQSAPGFQAYARDNYGAHFTLQEAETYRETFLHVRYRGLIPWHDRRRQEARDNGFVRSAYGFIRRIPNIRSQEHDRRGEAERIAVNTGIQSASNDSALLAALEARRSGLVDDKRAQLLLFIHDELIYAVDEDYVDDFVPGLVAQMQNIPTERFGFSLRVPLIADAKVGRTLADMKTYEV